MKPVVTVVFVIADLDARHFHMSATMWAITTYAPGRPGAHHNHQ